MTSFDGTVLHFLIMLCMQLNNPFNDNENIKQIKYIAQFYWVFEFILYCDHKLL